MSGSHGRFSDDEQHVPSSTCLADMTQPSLCVVHLVRKVNGEAPLRSFLDSYRAHPAGAAHDLVLLLKGFDSPADSKPHRVLAADVCDRWVAVGDEGFDIGAYLAAARELPHGWLCFVNSFSRILADGWLGHMERPLRAPDVGLVGATGSWASPLTLTRYELGLGGAYAAVQGDRRRTLARLASLDPATSVGGKRARRLAWVLPMARSVARRLVGFEPFPAHHVRTNGFLVSSDTLAALPAAHERDKLAVHRFEHGRSSLTRRIQAKGLRAIVVGRDGHEYDQDAWHRSYTFRQGDQENLLIADKQTEVYANADAELRAILSRFAWGPAADPTGLQEAPEIVRAAEARPGP